MTIIQLGVHTHLLLLLIRENKEGGSFADQHKETNNTENSFTDKTKVFEVVGFEKKNHPLSVMVNCKNK